MQPAVIRFVCGLVLLGSTASGASALQVANSASTPDTPSALLGTQDNLLILLADDLGVDMLGAYGVGGDLPPTPNLDELAGAGVLFRNAWTNPVCSPTRAALLTGRFGFRTGVGAILRIDAPSLPLDEVTLPEMLRDGTQGRYATGAFGKWHLSNDYVDPATGVAVDPASGGLLNPNLAGFDHFAGSMFNLTCAQAECNSPHWNGPQPYHYFRLPEVINGVQNVVSAYSTTRIVDNTLEWIDQQDGPWLAYVAFHSPHSPFQAPPAQLNSSGLIPGSRPDPGEDARPYYKAMVEALDTEIGRLLRSLDPAVRARTTVVFLGDNGTPQQVTAPPFIASHAKATLYEGGVRVPLIVSGPAVSVAGESDALVNSTDLFATCAELAGVDPASVLPSGKRLDSISLASHLADLDQPFQRKTLFAEMFGPASNGQVCQDDQGLGVPGGPVLEICGEVLYAGNHADLTVRGAPPNSPAVCVGSTSVNPVPFLGGILGPAPILASWPLFTDATGAYQVELPGGTPSGKALDAYVQVLVSDPAQPAGVAFSNTVQLSWPDEFSRYHAVALRDARYKLIHVLDPGPLVAAYTSATVFFDLVNDPWELDNLLDGRVLSQHQMARYAKLEAELSDLLDQP